MGREWEFNECAIRLRRSNGPEAGCQNRHDRSHRRAVGGRIDGTVLIPGVRDTIWVRENAGIRIHHRIYDAVCRSAVVNNADFYCLSAPQGPRRDSVDLAVLYIHQRAGRSVERYLDTSELLGVGSLPQSADII